MIDQLHAPGNFAIHSTVYVLAPYRFHTTHPHLHWSNTQDGNKKVLSKPCQGSDKGKKWKQYNFGNIFTFKEYKLRWIGKKIYQGLTVTTRIHISMTMAVLRKVKKHSHHMATSRLHTTMHKLQLFTACTAASSSLASRAWPVGVVAYGRKGTYYAHFFEWQLL